MASKTLSPEQWVAVKWLSQPRKGGKTFEEIAEICGVHVNTLYHWRKDPLFERELKREMVRNTQDRLPELMTSMIEHAIKDGNAAAAKLIMTANDMLTDKVEVTNTSDALSPDEIRAKIEQYRQSTTD